MQKLGKELGKIVGMLLCGVLGGALWQLLSKNYYYGVNSSTMDLITIICAVIGAIAALAGAIIAGYALKTWKRQIQFQGRHDAALHIIESAHSLFSDVSEIYWASVQNLYLIKHGYNLDQDIRNDLKKDFCDFNKNEENIEKKLSLIYSKLWLFESSVELMDSLSIIHKKAMAIRVDTSHSSTINLENVGDKREQMENDYEISLSEQHKFLLLLFKETK